MTQDRIPLDAGSSRETVDILRAQIHALLRDYRQTEVADDDGGGYPLVDALTLNGCGIDMGEREIENIVSELMYVIASVLPSAPAVERVDRELVERLRARLGGVSSPVMRGDNISIVIAGYFEPGIENDELDDSGTWKQGAIDAADEILDAIHAHYASAISRLVKERDEARAGVSRLTALLAEADEVVRPFAEVAILDIDPPDFEPIQAKDINGLFFGHLRAARRYQQKREAK